MLLAFAVLGGAGAVIYYVASPATAEDFTEFYILGHSGRASGYPEEFFIRGEAVAFVRYDDGVSEEGPRGYVAIGIVNRENRTVEYAVSASIDDEILPMDYDGDTVTGIEDIILDHNERWEQRIGLIPGVPGEDLQIEFTLYKDGVPGDAQKLTLWVNVVED